MSAKPVEDLVAALNAAGQSAQAMAVFTAGRWRRLFTRGGAGRIAARAAVALFPLRVTLRAALLRSNTVIATTNPFYLPLVLVLLRGVHRSRVVALMYDVYPDALVAAGLIRRNGLAARVGARANRYLFARADAVVFLGPSVAKVACESYGRPQLVEVIETGADPSDFQTSQATAGAENNELARWLEGGIVAAYVGNLGAMHDVATIAEAIPRVLAQPSARDLKVLVAASGSGAQALKARWKGTADSRLRVVGPLEDALWARVLGRADVAIVTLAERAWATSVPSKTFSALAAGSAILAVAPSESDVARLVRDAGAGWVVEPGDVQGLVRRCTEILEAPEQLARARENARRAAERYDVRALALRWTSLLERIVAQGARRNSTR